MKDRHWFSMVVIKDWRNSWVHPTPESPFSQLILGIFAVTLEDTEPEGIDKEVIEDMLAIVELGVVEMVQRAS